MTEPDQDKKGAERLSPNDEAERRRKAKEAFECGLIERGEAAFANKEGQLPPGATHEILGYDAEGHPILKRRRFSAG